jgi:hypothetical protein
MAFGGKISRGLGTAQKGGQTAKQRLHFLWIENSRLNLQSGTASGHQRKIRFDRPLQLGGSNDLALDLLLLIISSTLGGIPGSIPGGNFGGIRCHLDGLLRVGSFWAAFFGLRRTFAGCSERTLP